MSERTALPRVRLALLVATLAAAVAAFALPSAASSAPPGCKNRTNHTYQQLLTCMTVEGVHAHQEAFQKIADNNKDPFYPGSRAAGTKGYADSVKYVTDLMRGAGYNVTHDEFQFTFVFPVEINQLTPVQAKYPSGTFTGSGFGEITGKVIPVDINLVPPRASTSGCEAADFAGLDFSGASDIALIQRGTCSFAIKAVNAQAAGAEAVVIFNQGNTAEREGLIVGTLIPGGETVTIPVVGGSFTDGVALSAPASTAHIDVREPEERTDVNVIAELPGTNTNNIVMAGAHLDSVGDGPGINDNGSGSAAILETALMMAKVKPENTLRFAWWGAEEEGLVGSTAYVNELATQPGQLDRIALYMNYDMVGSPNYVQMVYDADLSGFPVDPDVPIPAGSTAIEDLYESYYTLIGEPYDDAEFSGRSDYQAFIDNGIPSGGLFTGAEEPKTALQQSIWGGIVGEQLDPCYHEACDSLDNYSPHALGVNADLIAFAQLTFAFSTQSVNGVPGRAVPGSASMPLPEPAGAEGTTGP